MALSEADHLLALSCIRGIGGIRARTLLQHLGTGEAIFQTPFRLLKRIPGLPEEVARSISTTDVTKLTETVREDCHRLGIRMIAFSDADYPPRLSECPDAPLVLFFKGNSDLRSGPVLSIVGTRKMSEYGKWAILRLLDELKAWSPVVVSGLAYGVDITAHRVALQAGLETIAVLPGGIDQVYPPAHRQVLDKMMAQGGALSEMPPGTVPEKEYFPVRNRIIAGISDGVLVVESGASGGSMITAYLAQSYHRDVLALPGRINDPYSQGTNALISSQVAQSVSSGRDIASFLNWERNSEPPQLRLFDSLDGEEKELGELIGSLGHCTFDEIMIKLEWPHGKVSSLLLSLECRGIIRRMPGDRLGIV